MALLLYAAVCGALCSWVNTVVPELVMVRCQVMNVSNDATH